jgi:type IV pilus assembly protein PilV
MRRLIARLRRRAGGFSMMELLVAVLVMGIGVLGISGLQMVSLQNNRGALMRGEAVQLAYDMMDRIRANPAGAVPGLAYGGLALGDGPPEPPDCDGGTCSQEQMVAYDQAVWKCTLGAYQDDAACAALRDPDDGVLRSLTEQPGLPGGDGAVDVNPATGVITVTVQWTETNDVIRTVSVESEG